MEKRVLITKLIAILFLIFLARVVFAQENKIDALTNIKISVVDSLSKEPIIGCTLIVFDRDDNNIFLGVSNSAGIIDLKIDLKTAFKFRFAILGYQTKERNLNFSNKTSATIGLIPSVIALEEVKIKGAIITRDADRLRYNVNTQKFLKGADALAVLRDVPLLAVSAQGSIGVKNNPAVVLVNGRQVNNLQLMAISAEKIESVDVITNPSSANSATDSNIGGIVTIKLKESDIPQFTGSLNLMIGSLSKVINPGFSLSANSKKAYANFYLFSQAPTSISNSQYLVHNLIDNIKESEHFGNGVSKFKMQNFSGDFFYDIKKDERISIGLGRYKTNIKFDNFGSDHFYDRGLNNTFSFFSEPSITYQIDAEYKKTFSNKSSFVFRYNFKTRTREKSQELSSIDQLSDTSNLLNTEKIRNNTHIFQFIYRKNLFKDKLKTELGATFVQNNSANNFSTAVKAKISAFNQYNSHLVSLEQQSNALFLILRYNLKGYSLRSGLRYEHLVHKYISLENNFNAIYNNLFPNLVLQKALGKNVDLIFNYQRKISRPDISILNPNQYQYNHIESYSGNPKVMPELINKYDLNFDLKTDKSFYEFAIYTTYTKNPIVYIGSRNTGLINNTYQNVKSLFVYGADLSVKNNLTDNLSINSSVFAEQYNFSKNFPQTIYNQKFNTGGDFSAYYNFRKVFAANLSFNYKLIDRNYAYQSYRENNLVTGITISKTMLKNRLYASFTCTDVFNTSSETRSYYNDTFVSRSTIALNKPDIFLFSISYSFGKEFNIGKSRTSIDKSGEEASFKKL